MEVNKDLVPKFNELIEPVLQALTQLGGGGTNKQIVNKVIKIIDIPKNIANIRHNDMYNSTELEYRIAWAKTYLKKAGYITNKKRNFWTINKNADINSADSKVIVELVRKQVSEVAENLKSPDITTIEATQVFESYVIQTIEYYLSFENKKLTKENISNKADLYISDGFGDIDKSVYIEIAIPSNPTEWITEYCEKAKTWIDNRKEQLLFIIGGMRLDSKPLEKTIKEKFDIDITIWDIYELIEKIPLFAAKLDFLSNPRATIVENVIKEKNDDKLIVENKEKIKALQNAYKSEKLVLFLGAGVSIDAGVPLWDTLINKLLLRMINLKIDESNESNEGNDIKKVKFTQKDINNISEIAFNNKESTPLLQMRYIRAALNTDIYYNAVHDELYANNIKVDTKLLNSISKISTPRRQHKGLDSIVTYNFDDLLEQNLKKWNVDYNVIQSSAKMPVTNKLNIYHVHGYLPQDELNKDERAELIFSEEDYHRVYGDAYCWSNMAQVKSFQDNTCLFVGCSLTDPNLRRLLDSAMRHPEKTRHFAILKRKRFKIEDAKKRTTAVKWYQDFDDGIRNQIFKSFGISVIWVNEYSEIPDILNGLIDNNE